MGKHASVEDNEFAAGSCKEPKSMKMSESSDVEGHCQASSRNPRQHPTVGCGEWKVSNASKEMSVSNQHRSTSASRHLDFQCVQRFSRPESRHYPHLQASCPLLQFTVEEIVQVGFPMREPQICMVARNTVQMNGRNGCQRTKEVIRKQLSTLGNLFKTEKFQLVGLFEVNRLAIYDVTEEQNMQAINTLFYSNFGNLLGEGRQGRLRSGSIPCSGLATEVEV